MIIFPAIDILDGKAVRLMQGRLDAVTVYNDDPVDQARRFIDSGAEWIHVVDLDGAVLGTPANIEIVHRIAALGVPVQTGGGIRSMSTIDHMFEAGVRRVVLGTALVKEPALVAEACERYGGIVAGVDARDGKVAIEGWREGTSHGVLELVRELELLGVKRLAYTDISKDGMQTGVNYGAYRALVSQVEIPIVASGGVSTLDDIRDLLSLGSQLEGVIVGRALYEGAFSLEDAIAAGRGD
ncbi:MAG: 1-(5-phosphoribosyl)-5-[(5-phosphoribosylamino)methylideneamino]imidazole-4-carboxamide isomerase [Aeromicrobium sp.]|jgi:phosphoribosylformimino-5-aminoimidazole carboxamide ribotide isomerase|nr:1-(5-phosphoribosyl)-5-[(5-phosphoribosylamino)methylideneamino]imidazole-4-carboxamide isomerase [Aeromicrobium sp.]